jgi:two-component system, response regulator YesN
MPLLSKRILQDVGRTYVSKFGIRPVFMDFSGRLSEGAAEDRFAEGPALRRRRSYALQESISRGDAYVVQTLPGLSAWVLALEDRRMIHGGLYCGDVIPERNRDRTETTVRHLVAQGMGEEPARSLVARTPVWNDARLRDATQALFETFYQISGWAPELLKENRLRRLQQEQINQAVEEQRRGGGQTLYAFEKERALLANIRTGDRNAARQILNDMLAVIYLSSSQLAVLRARAVELMSCLTRAAIEDNPLMEPLIERNHAWTERLVRARSFEELSQVLMDALDDFIDAIYLHGANRSNTKVMQAMDFISANIARPISLRTVAAEVGLSSGRLAHLVKEVTGRSVLQIVQQARVRHAQNLLERTSRSCTEIAYETGYNDQSYFIKHFRRITGTTPSRYRRFRTKAPVETESVDQN